MEQTPNKSKHIKLTLKKNILPPLLPGFELAIFRSRVRRSYQQAIQAQDRPTTVSICQLSSVAGQPLHSK